MMLSLLVVVLAAYNPQIVPAEFQATVDNPFYPLAPGTTWRYVEKSGGATSTNVITVSHETKTVMGVTAKTSRVLRESVLARDTTAKKTRGT